MRRRINYATADVIESATPAGVLAAVMPEQRREQGVWAHGRMHALEEAVVELYGEGVL